MKLFNRYESSPNPAMTYDEAVERIELWRHEDTSDILPECHLHFASHGKKTDKSIIFFHGYTACPNQFIKLGNLFYKQGYNVLIPRLELHGHQDRMTNIHTKLTTDMMIRFADKAVDIAQGLSDEVSVAGLSMGGIISAWVAQNRVDVDQAMIISPAMAYTVVPFRLTRAVMLASMAMPNRYGWWNPDQEDKGSQPPYVYPRYATKALAQLTRLTFGIRRQASKIRPATRSIIVVTNAGDQHVDHRMIKNIVKLWRDKGHTNVRICEFTPEQGLLHDFIDPSIVGDKTSLVYPILVDLMINDQPETRMMA